MAEQNTAGIKDSTDLKQKILSVLDNADLKYKDYDEFIVNAASFLRLSILEVTTEFNRMLKSGEVVEKPKGHYITAGSTGLVRGKISATARKFAFLEPLDGTDDIFIAPTNLKGALNNDIVLASVADSTTKEGSKEATVVKIVEHKNTSVVGTFRQFKSAGFVIPDDARFASDVYIAKDKVNGAKEGDVVVATLTDFKENKNPEGYVSEIIGDRNDPGNDVLALMRQYKVYQEFGTEVIAEAKKVPLTVTEKDKESRADFTKDITFTIDGKDAKDFDDAVSLKINRNGTYELGVHIADVTNYVKEGSPLDNEAYKRGTSIYFCDRVVPMLPFELSNDICSLREGVERLTLSCIMTIDKNGEVINHRICEAVIKSNHRLTYNEVFGIINKEPELLQKYSDIVEMIDDMSELSKILDATRQKRGAIDFDFAETQLVLDERGKLIDVCPRETNAAHKIIETFMVIANEVIAEHYYKLKVPFIYRIHEKPDAEKMTAFFNFLNLFGVSYHNINAAMVTPKDLQQLLESLDGLPSKDIISMLMLRSLKKARYSPECLGHFGLASTYYCHFTSPIRRYPDLAIHRIIKLDLHKKIDSDTKEKLIEFVNDASEISSEREKLSEEMERAVDDIKKTEFMGNHIGEQFEGIINGVIPKGFFVTLPNTCEGFVGFENMPNDFYTYDENKLMLVGKKGGFFRMGEKVQVEVLDINMRERKTNFKCLKKIV